MASINNETKYVAGTKRQSSVSSPSSTKHAKRFKPNTTATQASTSQDTESVESSAVNLVDSSSYRPGMFNRGALIKPTELVSQIGFHLVPDKLPDSGGSTPSETTETVVSQMTGR